MKSPRAVVILCVRNVDFRGLGTMILNDYGFIITLGYRQEVFYPGKKYLYENSSYEPVKGVCSSSGITKPPHICYTICFKKKLDSVR